MRKLTLLEVVILKFFDEWENGYSNLVKYVRGLETIRNVEHVLMYTVIQLIKEGYLDYMLMPTEIYTNDEELIFFTTDKGIEELDRMKFYE